MNWRVISRMMAMAYAKPAHPTKENFQGFSGIAARTGKSNFDISEWMLIQLKEIPA